MQYMGIDPGQKGAISLINKKGDKFESIPMPDLHNLHEHLHKWKIKYNIKHCFLEHAQAMPKQGVSSTFTYGRGFGALEALLIAHEIPFTLVKPRDWQKEMFKGTAPMKAGEKRNPKERALEAIRRLFPKNKFTFTLRAVKPHDGMIDSVLLAELCRRKII